jgi:AcrR family transcriptional regulator
MTVRARRYRSTLRDEQARATRRRIVDAGQELFIERGYGPTTIDAIAERAGVSRKTVFTSVGSKAAVLKLAFDWALAGDDEPVAIADRPEVQKMMKGDDPAVLLAEWIAMNAAIAGRVAALHHVLVVAADTDPDAAALLALLEQQRTHGAHAVATRLHAIHGLRPTLDVDRAAAIADLLIDPLPYRRLVQQRGWTPDEYTDYLRHTAAAALLPPKPPRPRRRTPTAGRTAR